MSWLEIGLLWGLFESAFLVQYRLPIVGLSANNLAVPVCALALAVLSRSSIEPTWRAHRRLLGSTALVYVWVWVATASSTLPALSARFAVKCAAYLIVGFCFLVLLHRRAAIRPARRTVYAILVALAAGGILEYWLPLVPFVALRGHLATYPRVASFFLWPNQFGVLMAVAVALGATLQQAGVIRPRSFHAPLGLLLLALALSGSRNGWFVLATLLAVLGIVRVVTVRRLTVIAAAFALIVLIAPVSRVQLGLPATPPVPLLSAFWGSRDLSRLVDPTQTLAPRLQLWRAALAEIGRRPLTGLGPEVFPVTVGAVVTGQNGINTHNVFLNAATELGLIGFALFAGWLWVLIRCGDPREWTASVPLLGIGVGQLFDCFTYDYAFMVFSFFFIASYASAPRDDR
jgi:O-antigen ligase